MSAAHAFGLDGLQRHCEIALSHHLTLENVASVYKTAKLYEASYLVTYCNGFMLRHLPALVASGGGSGGDVTAVVVIGTRLSVDSFSLRAFKVRTR